MEWLSEMEWQRVFPELVGKAAGVLLGIAITFGWNVHGIGCESSRCTASQCSVCRRPASASANDAISFGHLRLRSRDERTILRRLGGQRTNADPAWRGVAHGNGFDITSGGEVDASHRRTLFALQYRFVQYGTCTRQKVPEPADSMNLTHEDHP